MEDDKTSPLQATSLDGLLVAAQHFLAFGAIVTALGFPAGGISHRVIAVPGIESAPDGLLYAIVTADDRELRIAMGPAVPAMAAWLARAAELWVDAARPARDALYDRSVFSRDRHRASVPARPRPGFADRAGRGRLSGGATPGTSLERGVRVPRESASNHPDGCRLINDSWNEIVNYR